MFQERLFPCARNCRRAVRKDSAFGRDRHGPCDGCGGSIPRPEGRPVEATVCVRKRRRASQATGGSGRQNTQSRAGQPTAGKSGKKRCHRTPESQGLLFSLQTQDRPCARRSVTHGIWSQPAEPGRADVSTADVGTAAPLRHSPALSLSTSFSYLPLCPPEFPPMCLYHFPKITVNQYINVCIMGLQTHWGFFVVVAVFVAWICSCKNLSSLITLPSLKLCLRMFLQFFT